MSAGLKNSQAVKARQYTRELNELEITASKLRAALVINETGHAIGLEPNRDYSPDYFSGLFRIINKVILFPGETGPPPVLHQKDFILKKCNKSPTEQPCPKRI